MLEQVDDGGENVYIVGFVDNSNDLFDDYTKRFSRRDIILLSPQEGMSKEDILNWILSSNIRCLMVDYKLRPNFDFVGTDLVAYINSALPDLPCMILTAYPQESLNENLVIENMIEDRSVLDSRNFEDFTDKLKQAVHVFNKRLLRHEEEYRAILTENTKNTLVVHDEERKIELYKILKAYELIDELPAELLRSEVGKRVDTVIDKLTELLDDNYHEGE